MKLYDLERSGNCYKIRLFLSLLGLEYQRLTVSLPDGDHLKPEFLKINPRAQIPVLEDGDVKVWDSLAILVYLARRYGGEEWLPSDAAGEAEVMQWLAVSENEVLYGLALSRSITSFGRPGSLESAQQLGRAALQLLDDQLSGREWLALERPTIADIACYPYSAMAPEGGLPLQEYPHVLAWQERIKAWPQYVPLPPPANSM